MLDCSEAVIVRRRAAVILQSAEVLPAFTSTFTAMPAGGEPSIASQSPRSTSGLDLGRGR